VDRRASTTATLITTINLAGANMAGINTAVTMHRAGRTRRSRPHDAGDRAPDGAGRIGARVAMVPHPADRRRVPCPSAAG
jgi:hypothetical protein